MCIVRRAMYFVLRAMCSAGFLVLRASCRFEVELKCALVFVQCAMCNVQCAVCNVQCVWCIVFGAVCSVHCAIGLCSM